MKMRRYLFQIHLIWIFNARSKVMGICIIKSIFKQIKCIVEDRNFSMRYTFLLRDYVLKRGLGKCVP